MEGKIHAVYGGPGGSNTNEKENMNRKKKRKENLHSASLHGGE